MVDLKSVAQKWQKRWESSKIFEVHEDPKKKKYYLLEMFPYPSGSGLHMGHARNYVIGDVLARFKRMQGFNVLYPMGYDAFGLPAENAAIKAKSHPKQYTEQSIVNFIRQQKELGLSYDWSRMVITCHPDYYRWNQWFFLQFFKKGLAYKKKAPVNWCDSCQTVLANEQVEKGTCWRCHQEVRIKHIEQWFFKITDYAERLLHDLDKLDGWSERMKSMQRNWIGKSEGTEILFEIPMSKETNFILLHGYTGSPESNFFPWLKRELENRGHKVSAPKLPNTNNPNVMEQVEYVLKNCEFNNDTILVGHSLGGPVALKVVESLTKPIKKLVLAAGFIEPNSKDKSYVKTFNWTFNTKKIRKNVSDIFILKDINDKEIRKDAATKLNKAIGGTIVEFKAEDQHICGKEEPIVLQSCLNNLPIFTTRPDTLFGVTFLTFAPEHPKVTELIKGTRYEQETQEFIKKTVIQDRFSRAAEEQEKEGLFLGKYAIHPFTKEKIPIYTANFVLMDYGTGIVMGVPAHDQRDYEFATKYNIPIKEVIEIKDKVKNKANDGDGVLMNSGTYSGMTSEGAKQAITKDLKKNKKGDVVTHYKMRDWLISRQRYWGTPIPVVYCQTCGTVPVPEKDLPVKLPEQATFTGEGNPLLKVASFVNTTCPACKGRATRETDTMDTFIDSSWYFLRYCDPQNTSQPLDQKKARFWMPIDQYIGGAEHAVMHLLYARFFTKVLKDLKLVDINEPFPVLFNQGMLHKDGYVMSKSKGNVVTQEEIAKEYGIDTARIYLMSLASPEKDIEWSEKDIEGSNRFLKKVIGVCTEKEEGSSDRRLEHKMHSTIKQVTTHLLSLQHHEAIRAIVSYTQFLSVCQKITRESKETVALLLAPFAPHTAEDLWEILGHKPFISLHQWPSYNEKKIDSKIDAEEDFLSSIKGDIDHIKKITNIKPTQATFIIAEPWKYSFFSEIKNVQSRDPKEIMKAIKSKQHLKEGMKYIQAYVKGNLNVDVPFTQQEELKILKEHTRKLEKELGMTIHFETADQSKDPKAKNALPAKPAIILA